MHFAAKSQWRRWRQLSCYATFPVVASVFADNTKGAKFEYTTYQTKINLRQPRNESIMKFTMSSCFVRVTKEFSRTLHAHLFWNPTNILDDGRRQGLVTYYSSECLAKTSGSARVSRDSYLSPTSTTVGTIMWSSETLSVGSGNHSQWSIELAYEGFLLHLEGGFCSRFHTSRESFCSRYQITQEYVAFWTNPR